MKFISQDRDISIPDGVSLSVKARTVTVTGPRGSLTKNLQHVMMDISQPSKSKINVKVWHGKRKHVACIRTICSIIENMITGVTKGFEYKMRFVYAHFPINANISDKGDHIEIRNFLGDKNTRRIQMLEGVSIKMSEAQKDEVILVGNDVQAVSQSGIFLSNYQPLPFAILSP